MHLALFRLDPLVTFVPDLQRSTGFSFYHFGLWFDPISIFAQVLSLFLFHPFFWSFSMHSVGVSGVSFSHDTCLMLNGFSNCKCEYDV